MFISHVPFLLTPVVFNTSQKSVSVIETWLFASINLPSIVDASFACVPMFWNPKILAIAIIAAIQNHHSM